MQFHRAIAGGPDLEAACREAADAVREGLGAGPIDLAIVFASPRYGAIVDRLPVLLHELLAPRALVGCSGAVLVTEQEALAGRHGIVVLAGRLPGAHLGAIALAPGELPDADAPPAAWRALLPALPTPPTGMLVLTEPFQADARALLGGLDFAFPGVTKVGAVASGSRHPEGHALFCDRSTHHAGAVVLTMGGAIGLDGVVAPGCRGFGRSGRITRADGHRLLTIDEQPARRFVRDQLGTLTAEERAIAEVSPLLLGLSPDPFAATADDDVLVRTILGVDAAGELVTCQHLTVGRSVRLLMRCPDTGLQQVRRRLADADAASAAGALLFQCLGRSSADHATFASLATRVPLVGFHGNGEIGPLGGETHVHAFAAAFGLFRRRPS